MKTQWDRDRRTLSEEYEEACRETEIGGQCPRNKTTETHTETKTDGQYLRSRKTATDRQAESWRTYMKNGKTKIKSTFVRLLVA